ncbi:unnamed protein product [Adineta steineri]|uniref:Cytochrome b561 domain-containing protein n=1 Tax=Adineta steineri TaxID=433720 RepID=A0A815RW43_9BILA|nr:unnamed protein product [Adineta steineri]CAF1638611.1 unnamed protein product [Adineta steineri]
MGKGNFDENGSIRLSLRWYYSIVVCSQIIGVIAVILIGVFLGKYRGGFGWGSDLEKVFNYHPLFMTLGMVFFYGDAILVYRVFRDVQKIYIKILHASLLLISLILTSIGLKAVFDSHNRASPPQENLNSLHSWIGLTTVVLFGLQWICGFVAFLFPKLSENIRKAYMPSHKFWGKFIFIFGVSAVLMGITEYGIFNQLFDDKKLRNQRNMINIFGFFIVVFAVIIVYLVDNDDFQRPPDNDTEHAPLIE